MKEFLIAIEKYLPLVLVGVHAANTVPAATNQDKKTTVWDTVTGVTDAVAAASGNPTIQAAGIMIDVAASIINKLTSKTTPAPAAQ